MARQKITDQVKTLRQQQKDLADKLKQATRKAREDAKATHQRKCELAGEIALGELEANPAEPFAIALNQLLQTNLTKAAHREFFGFEPLPKEAKADTGEGD